MTNSTPSVLVFLHIPKTAGTTLNRVLRLKYESPVNLLRRWLGYERGDDWRAHVDKLRAERSSPRSIRVFKGRHFGFGIHALIPQRATYLTMLRDPINRVLSSYSYTRPQGSTRDISIEEYLRNGRPDQQRFYTTFTDNVQVRALAGDNGQRVDVPIGACTRAMLERAKERIHSHFLLVGLAEEFDASLLLLKRKLGWRTCYYVTSNVTQERLHVPDLPPETVDLIRELNSLDSELYAYAKNRLHEEIERAGPSFDRELKVFQARNRLYNAALKPVYRHYARWRSWQSYRS